MRQEACSNLRKELKKKSRIFSLTAPTGSGKTLMLLSLAGEIIKHRENLRIIYALPFLSITEQVEDVCNKVFEDINEYICRIDSKSENKEFDELQVELDSNPQKIKEIISMQFAEDTFDYPFIITTFVRLFETLASNRNATLLKLPNFANVIFLIDEIQSLPPRLYGFFIALLEAFCRKFNSYAIISTATMPNFELPSRNDLHDVFSDYSPPAELLSLDYFGKQVFNRYQIERLSTPIELEELANLIEKESSSTLVILNTIKDTRKLYDELIDRYVDAEILLLNTHFTPSDREEKINKSRELLKQRRVILISTQLIEAGVDIDFPVVYRDLCPLPSIVQSSGRCNRNGKLSINGKVVLFDLVSNERSRSLLIYKGRDSRFLNFAKEKISNSVYESQLFDIQKSFFNDIQANTLFGVHYRNNEEIDFVKEMKSASFATIGKFRLIDEQNYGEEYRYYVPQGSSDNSFEKLQELMGKLANTPFTDFERKKLKKIEIENHLKKMAYNIVQVRLRKDDIKPTVCSDSCCGLYKISSDSYDKDTGIKLSVENQIL